MGVKQRPLLYATTGRFLIIATMPLQFIAIFPFFFFLFFFFFFLFSFFSFLFSFFFLIFGQMPLLHRTNPEEFERDGQNFKERMKERKNE